MDLPTELLRIIISYYMAGDGTPADAQGSHHMLSQRLEPLRCHKLLVELGYQVWAEVRTLHVPLRGYRIISNPMFDEAPPFYLNNWLAETRIALPLRRQLRHLDLTVYLGHTRHNMFSAGVHFNLKQQAKAVIAGLGDLFPKLETLEVLIEAHSVDDLYSNHPKARLDWSHGFFIHREVLNAMDEVVTALQALRLNGVVVQTVRGDLKLNDGRELESRDLVEGMVLRWERYRVR